MPPMRPMCTTCLRAQLKLDRDVPDCVSEVNPVGPKLALLRGADRLRDCLFIGLDRKRLTRGQNDAIDPTRTAVSAGGDHWKVASWEWPRGEQKLCRSSLI